MSGHLLLLGSELLKCLHQARLAARDGVELQEALAIGLVEHLNRLLDGLLGLGDFGALHSLADGATSVSELQLGELVALGMLLRLAQGFEPGFFDRHTCVSTLR